MLTLVSVVIFQGIWTSIAKKPYNFVIFQVGEGAGPPVPTLDLRMLFLLARPLRIHQGYSTCLAIVEDVVMLALVLVNHSLNHECLTYCVHSP